MQLCIMLQTQPSRQDKNVGMFLQTTDICDLCISFISHQRLTFMSGDEEAGGGDGGGMTHRREGCQARDSKHTQDYFLAFSS